MINCLYFALREAFSTHLRVAGKLALKTIYSPPVLQSLFIVFSISLSASFPPNGLEGLI